MTYIGDVLAQGSSDECILWPGSKNKDGYGSTGRGQAHRVVYEQLVGPIPSGLQIDHICRQRACVNVAHLDIVTFAENQRRRVAARTHCARGHEWTPENTRLRKGVRQCRACQRESSRKYLARQRGVQLASS